MRRIENAELWDNVQLPALLHPVLVLAPLAAHLSLFAGFMDLAGDNPTLNLLTFINQTNQ